MQRNGYALVGLLLGLATLASGCAGPISPERAHPPLHTTVTPADGWVRVHRPGVGAPGGFSFSVPPRFQKLNLQPIDSDAAVYARADAGLHYDFGAYTSAPSVEGTDGVKTRMRIGGRTAIVVSYRRPDNGRYVVKAWWADVSKGRLGANHLLMVAEFRDAQDRPELLAAIYSVRFE